MWYWQNSGFYKNFKVQVSFRLRILENLPNARKCQIYALQSINSFVDVTATEI